MKKTVLAISTTLLALGLLAPPIVHADWNEVRGDRRELLKDQRQFDEAWRHGDRKGMANESREIQKDRQELRGDIRDAHRDSYYDSGRYGWGAGRGWSRYDQHGRFDDPRYDHYDRYDSRPESYGWYRPWWPMGR